MEEHRLGEVIKGWGETKQRFTFLHHSQVQALFWGLLPFVGLPSSNVTQKWYFRQAPGFVTSSFCCSPYLTDGRFLTKTQTPPPQLWHMAVRCTHTCREAVPLALAFTGKEQPSAALSLHGVVPGTFAANSSPRQLPW